MRSELTAIYCGEIRSDWANGEIMEEGNIAMSGVFDWRIKNPRHSAGSYSYAALLGSALTHASAVPMPIRYHTCMPQISILGPQT